MLQGPVNTPERFTLMQVNNVLQLADRFMDPKEPFLFKMGGKDAAVDYFLQEMALYLKCHVSLFEIAVVRNTQITVQQIQSNELLSCNMNHEWAHLIKQFFMRGNILKLNDIRVICCRTIFVDALKKQFTASSEQSFDKSKQKMLVNFDKLDRFAVQALVYEFMAQLLNQGFTPSVKAIHDFLYLAKKIAKTPESGMSIEQIAVTIAPCLCSGLHLNGVLSPELNHELRFITAVVTVLLNTNRFDAIFTPALYADYHQNSYESLYVTLMPALSDPCRLIDFSGAYAPDTKLDTFFRKLKINKDQSSTTAYASDELSAALDANEEEPLWTPALATGKWAIDTKRSRHLRDEQHPAALRPEDAIIHAPSLLYSQSLATTTTTATTTLLQAAVADAATEEATKDNLKKIAPKKS